MNAKAVSTGLDAIGDMPADMGEPANQSCSRGIMTAEVENVVANALMVATAFRLRDEQALVDTLRRLTAAVARLDDE